MLVRFLCPACHQLLGIAPRKVGAQVNCPKCGATILVPDPEEPRPTEGSQQSTSTEAEADFTAGDNPASEMPALDLGIQEDVPPAAVGSDVLGDLTEYERPERRDSPSPASSISPKKRPPPLDLPLDDGDRIVISRRVLYFQAVLLAVVGVLALVAGYLIGSGTRLHGP
jgi:hypothetical protein